MAKPLISLRLDERLVRNARKVLKAKSRTQTIEMSLEAVVELNKHRKLIREPIMNEAVIPKIEDAVAFAEGFFVAGSRLYRNNNPGDLERDLTSKGSGWDGPYVIYATPQDGWEALRHQVRLMFEGRAHAKQTSAELARFLPDFA